MRKCQINQVTWEAMQKKLIEAKGGREGVGDELSSHVMPHIEDALNFIDVLSQGCQSTQVFVTGSLHLIGGVLSFIHPDCYEKSPEDLQYESQIDAFLTLIKILYDLAKVKDKKILKMLNKNILSLPPNLLLKSFPSRLPHYQLYVCF